MGHIMYRTFWYRPHSSYYHFRSTLKRGPDRKAGLDSGLDFGLDFGLTFIDLK